jgi:hypothetical protein
MTHRQKSMTNTEVIVSALYIYTTPHLKYYKRKWIKFMFTNHQNIGLISTDRGTKATLMLTIPCSIFKSFTKDLSLSIFELVIQHRSHSSFYEEPCRLQCYDLEPVRKQAYTYSFNIRESVISPLSSMDSGLEAFSRNPTHGSFSALTFQSTDLPIM